MDQADWVFPEPLDAGLLGEVVGLSEVGGLSCREDSREVVFDWGDGGFGSIELGAKGFFNQTEEFARLEGREGERRMEDGREVIVDGLGERDAGDTGGPHRGWLVSCGGGELDQVR